MERDKAFAPGVDVTMFGQRLVLHQTWALRPHADEVYYLNMPSIKLRAATHRTMTATRRVKEKFRQHRECFTNKAQQISDKFQADVYVFIVRDSRWYSYKALSAAVKESVYLLLYAKSNARSRATPETQSP